MALVSSDNSVASFAAAVSMLHCKTRHIHNRGSHNAVAAAAPCDITYQQHVGEGAEHEGVGCERRAGSDVHK